MIGVVERAWVDGEKKRGYAKVRFSRNKFAQEVLQDVRDGILRGVSFGYSIDKMEEREDGLVATNWSPYEVSLAVIPADPTVGVGRSLETSDSDVNVGVDRSLEDVDSDIETAASHSD
jgi:phage head maturation protease